MCAVACCMSCPCCCCRCPSLLLHQVSALPVVNDQGQLLDIYARSDITKLCKGNAYSRLQWEDVTVNGPCCLREGGCAGHCVLGSSG
jgi:hypothetical protein